MIIFTYLLLIVDNEADVGSMMNRRKKKQGREKSRRTRSTRKEVWQRKDNQYKQKEKKMKIM